MTSSQTPTAHHVVTMEDHAEDDENSNEKSGIISGVTEPAAVGSAVTSPQEAVVDIGGGTASDDVTIATG